jgi:plasmid stability protein
LVEEKTARMTHIAISDLDEPLARGLCVHATAERSRSMEEETRDILRCAPSGEAETQDNLADGIRRLIEPLDGAELPPFPRGQIREPPDLT